MMNRAGSHAGGLFLVLAVCLSVSGSAEAGGLYLQVHGGLATVNLDDVNDAVDSVNQDAGGDYLDNIGRGWDAGLTVGYDITRNLGLGLGYARLWASSEYSADGTSVIFDMPADYFEITLDYLPAETDGIRVGAGSDVGMLSSAASWAVTDPFGDERKLSFDGLGFLFAGYVIVDAPLADNWSVYGQGGFRHAIINKVKIDGEIVYNPDSLDDKLRFNYSGVFLRLGVTFRP
jgi:hypothetical protein